jgi:hypothetical protein
MIKIFIYLLIVVIIYLLFFKKRENFSKSNKNVLILASHITQKYGNHIVTNNLKNLLERSILRPPKKGSPLPDPP